MAGLTRGRRAATAVIALLAVVSTGALSGCEWRRETPPPVWPTPDAVTAARDALALATDDVADAAATALAEDADDAFAATALVSAQAHLEALGGVYVAYPDATASPSPSAGVTPAPEPSLGEAIDAARVAAVAAEGAGDPELAALARSIDLEWALRVALAADGDAEQGATAPPSPTEASPAEPSSPESPPITGPTVDASTRTPFPAASGGADADAGFAPSAGTALTQADLAALALAHDHARFAYETIAAWEFGPARTTALALADFHGERSDEFAATLAEDPRTPVYQLRDANLPDTASRRALELDLELEIALTLAATLDDAPEPELPWLLNATFDAFARSSTAWGFTARDIPMLPGLDLVEPAA